MPYRELAILLPCHSIEDFPLYHTGEDADSLLAGWTALWHPALVAAAGRGPQWHRVDIPPDDLRGLLIIVPTVSASQLPVEFGSQARDAGAVLIRGESDRQSIVTAALTGLGTPPAIVPPALVADFFALGYGYLQVQLLTRQMRYSSNLDEARFFQELVAAAEAAVAGQEEASRARLAICFNLLGEERDHYYSVDNHLLDLTLVAATTLGSGLREWLQSDLPLNLLLSGQLVEMLAECEPPTLAAIRAALSEHRLGVAGGEWEEVAAPLLPCEDLLANLLRGQASYERHLGERLTVFGRRRYGLTPALPNLLDKLRFTGALHATLDEGTFPTSYQSKSRWQGFDLAAIDAIVKPPLDASRPETFLSLCQKLGEAMDSDHVATLCLAHWPGAASPWYEDLRRCCRHTSALGKFRTLPQYFADTYRPGSLDRFAPSGYQSPYLKQAVIRQHLDPLSATVSAWQQRAAEDTTGGLQLLAALLSNKKGVSPAPSDRSRAANAPWLESIVEGLTSRSRTPDSGSSDGLLWINPLGFPRRVGVTWESAAPLDRSPARIVGPVAKGGPIVASASEGNQSFAVLDLPSLGYAWTASQTSPLASRDAGPLLAEDGRSRKGPLWLRNEFFEVTLDPITGALKSLRDYETRRNRLSHQLALRTVGGNASGGVTAGPGSDRGPQYSVMAADAFRMDCQNAACGAITVQGRLLDLSGQLQARFQETFRVWRGVRVLELEVELDPVLTPGSDPWNSYYAARFAWPEEATTLAAGMNQFRQEVTKARIEAPLYLDAEAAGKRTTLLTGGLPYHRRIDARMLDTLLLVRGEQQRRFRLGIGLDLPNSHAEAWSFLAPVVRADSFQPAPQPATSWLLRFDTRSVTPTFWAPLWEAGQLVGVRVRVLENSGRAGRVRLSAYRPFVSARQVNFLGEVLSECPVEQGQIGIDIGAHEWIEVEGRWEQELTAASGEWTQP